MTKIGTVLTTFPFPADVLEVNGHQGSQGWSPNEHGCWHRDGAHGLCDQPCEILKPAGRRWTVTKVREQVEQVEPTAIGIALTTFPFPDDVLAVKSGQGGWEWSPNEHGCWHSTGFADCQQPCINPAPPGNRWTVTKVREPESSACTHGADCATHPDADGLHNRDEPEPSPVAGGPREPLFMSRKNGQGGRVVITRGAGLDVIVETGADGATLGRPETLALYHFLGDWLIASSGEAGQQDNASPPVGEPERPTVLRLPEIPPGAVALIDGKGMRHLVGDRLRYRAKGFLRSVFRHGDVTVEYAPPVPAWQAEAAYALRVVGETEPAFVVAPDGTIRGLVTGDVYTLAEVLDARAFERVEVPGRGDR